MALIHLAAVDDHVVTLGPEPAVGIFVQGCDRGCPGCASKYTWSASGGAFADTADVATWMNESSTHYVTVSGGEPMDQAPALVELIDAARRDRDWVVTCYSGYCIEPLRCNIRPGTAALVGRLDLLIDGPYLLEQHASLLWRGSSNQRIHNLSGRVELPPDESVGVTPVIHTDGSFELVGVYPEPALLERLVETLAERGRRPSVDTRLPLFPFPTRQEP